MEAQHASGHVRRGRSDGHVYLHIGAQSVGSHGELLHMVKGAVIHTSGGYLGAIDGFQYVPECGPNPRKHAAKPLCVLRQRNSFILSNPTISGRSTIALETLRFLANY